MRGTPLVFDLTFEKEKMAVAANEDEELQLILSLDDTDVDNDDQTSPSILQSTNNFTVSELIAVLERISSSCLIKAEADLATTILSNTRGKALAAYNKKSSKFKEQYLTQIFLYSCSFSPAIC